MLLGIRIACGRKPDLPAFILRKEIKHKTLERIVNLGVKVCTRIEKIAKPRMHFLQRSRGMVNLIGIGLASGGLHFFCHCRHWFLYRIPSLRYQSSC
jgi:hypothetical protein